MNSVKKMPEKHLDALQNTGTFGYLTTREIALLGWPGITPKAALKAAQSATTQLKADGLLMARELPINGKTNVYVLTRKGAARLNDELLQLCFTAGYDLEIGRQQMRAPVIDLAHIWAREKGLGVVGARGLVHDVFELSGFSGLDALLIDPDSFTPAFGILLVRTYDPATVARIQKLCKLSVPVAFAAAEHRADKVAAFAKIRAKVAPVHDEHLRWNAPAGLIC